MKKKIWIGILTFVLIFSLIGCGRGDSDFIQPDGIITDTTNDTTTENMIETSTVEDSTVDQVLSYLQNFY